MPVVLHPPFCGLTLLPLPVLLPHFPRPLSHTHILVHDIARTYAARTAAFLLDLRVQFLFVPAAYLRAFIRGLPAGLLRRITFARLPSRRTPRPSRVGSRFGPYHASFGSPLTMTTCHCHGFTALGCCNTRTVWVIPRRRLVPPSPRNVAWRLTTLISAHRTVVGWIAWVVSTFARTRRLSLPSRFFGSPLRLAFAVRCCAVAARVI